MQAIGHLGKDAVANNVNGKTVINFSVAHTEKYKDAGGNPLSKTIWVECSWWNDKTNIVPYLLKGTQVWAEGQPDVHTYPKNDGTTGVSLRLRIGSVQLLGSATANPNSHTPPATPYGAAPQAQQTQQQAAVEDLPF